MKRIERAAVELSAYCYSVQMLRFLLSLKLIDSAEYQKARMLCEEHYGVHLYCV